MGARSWASERDWSFPDPLHSEKEPDDVCKYDYHEEKARIESGGDCPLLEGFRLMSGGEGRKKRVPFFFNFYFSGLCLPGVGPGRTVRSLSVRPVSEGD